MYSTPRQGFSQKIRTLIVDDEPLARSGIATMLGEDSDVEVIGACADGMEALTAIRTQRPDLVYLDVQMPRLSGIEAIERLAPDCCPAVIFVTAFDHHAVRAFQAGAAGYLLKPFRDVHFWESLRRAKVQISHSRRDEAGRLPAPAAAPSRLAFKVGGDFVLVDADDVICLEAQSEFIRVVCVGGQVHRVRESLQNVERRLDPGKYVRVHRSFIVNRARIKRIAPTVDGDYTVLLSDGTKVRLSRTYRHQLKSLLPAHFP